MRRQSRLRKSASCMCVFTLSLRLVPTIADEEHAWGVFKTLDRLEELLADRDYLVGPGRGQLTEADVRLFPTIARFDNSYHYFFRYAGLLAFAKG